MKQLLLFLRKSDSLLPLVLSQLLLLSTLTLFEIISNKLRKLSKMRSSHNKVLFLLLRIATSDPREYEVTVISDREYATTRVQIKESSKGRRRIWAFV